MGPPRLVPWGMERRMKSGKQGGIHLDALLDTFPPVGMSLEEAKCCDKFIVAASLLCKSCGLNLRLEKKFLSVQKSGVIGLMRASMPSEPGLTQVPRLQVFMRLIFRHFNGVARIGCALVCPLFKATKELCFTMSQRF